MSEVLSALYPQIDAGLGGVLLANMVEAWLVGNSDDVTSVEADSELQNHGTTPEQTGLHLRPPVHAGVRCCTIRRARNASMRCARWRWNWAGANRRFARSTGRSEEHTSELQSPYVISY